ncbi:uncharacterized protein LOC144119392 isoform X1 [Amblyomma americanum]
MTVIDIMNNGTNSSDGLVHMDREALYRLFNVFLSVHLHSGDIEAPRGQRLQIGGNKTFGLTETTRDPASSPWPSTSAMPAEFGAPVEIPTAAPREDVALLLSVMLTTFCVFVCFLVLLAVKCCAHLCCIDLLYYIAHCGRPPPMKRSGTPSVEPVVVRLLPKRASLERLLEKDGNARKKAGAPRVEKKPFYKHSV